MKSLEEFGTGHGGLNLQTIEAYREMAAMNESLANMLKEIYETMPHFPTG